MAKKSSFPGTQEGSMKANMKDYQPGENQYAGKEMGKANQYVERHNKTVAKEASKIKGQAHMGRYD